MKNTGFDIGKGQDGEHGLVETTRRKLTHGVVCVTASRLQG